VSPKVQLKVTGATQFVVVAVKVTGEVASGEVGLKVKATEQACPMTIVWLDVAFTPSASVAVTVTVKDPEVA
jgi:hypothetical protein